MKYITIVSDTLQGCYNGRNGVWNHQPHHCLLNRLFRRRSQKTSMLRVPGLCAGNSSVTGEFPAQMASNAENVSIWWRHHATACSSQDHYSDPLLSTPKWFAAKYENFSLRCWISANLMLMNDYAFHYFLETISQRRRLKSSSIAVGDFPKHLIEVWVFRNTRCDWYWSLWSVEIWLVYYE